MARAPPTLALAGDGGICIGGGLALNVAMKLAFQRARPTFDEPLLTLSTYSFPSGHVLASTLLYGLCVAWVFVRTPRIGWRMLAVAGALAAIAGVAFTRMYLGSTTSPTSPRRSSRGSRGSRCA
jgi:undecaprenyl-diphosphatase